MSRRGNCHDNACAESFFSLLKKERIRRRTYPTRETIGLKVSPSELATLQSSQLIFAAFAK
jgi:transposase InsO family protein